MEVKPGYKLTEVGVIPEEWNVRPLYELAEKIMVGIASAATHAYRDRGVVLLRNQNIKTGFIDDSDLLYVAEDYEQQYRNKRLKRGDLLTARTGYPGTTTVVPQEYDGSQSFTTLITRPRFAIVDSLYLSYYINSSAGQAYFDQAQIGGGQKNVNAGSLKLMPVVVPASKAEQQAIAEALSDADAHIDSLERLIAKKRDLKQGAMQDLLTGKRRLPGFSGEWGVKSFGEIVSPARERIDPRRTQPIDFCIELEHIEQSTGRILGSTSTTQSSSLKSVFSKGDVLFGKLRPYLRKYWLATRTGVCSTEIWVLRPAGSQVLSHFLFQVVQTDQFIEAASSSYGTHMPRSDWNVARAFQVRLPTPPEQEAIAAVLTDMDAEIDALEAKLAKARAVKQGMMQELLTGRVRLI